MTRRHVLQAPLLLLAQDRDHSDMVRIPAGTFCMGTAEAAIETQYSHLSPRVREMLKSEAPRHEVTIVAFSLDRHEVTNRRFQAFVEANPQWRRERIDARFHNGEYLKHWDGGHFPEGQGAHPIIYVSWYAAMAFAEWAGKRLPTEAEWEYAAGGGRPQAEYPQAEYPWGGDQPTSALANFSGSKMGGAAAVGRYPANGFGLHDMAGNVWEYCLDEWRANYSIAPRPALKWADVSTRRVIRGGSWSGADVNLRVRFRDSHPPGGAGSHVGFRCAL